MRRLCAGIMMLAMLACGGDSATSASAAVVGNWTLSTLNATALPYPFSGSGANKSEVTGGALTVTATSYSVVFSVRNTVNNVPTTTTSSDAGTVAISGSSVTLHSTVDATTTLTGTVSGNTLTLSETGFVYVFTR